MSSRGRTSVGVAGVALLAALALLSPAGCTRAPRPAVAMTAAPVFPVTGDTSEVLSTIPDPATRPRPVAPAPQEGGDTGDQAADSAFDSTAAPDTADSVRRDATPPGQGEAGTPADRGAGSPAAPSGSTAAPPASAGSPTPPPAPAAPPARDEATLWVVQVFAGGDRAAAYREAQRAARELKLKDDEMTMIQDGRLWKVRIGSPGPREPAQALLERARRTFPRAFLLPLPAGTSR